MDEEIEPLLIVGGIVMNTSASIGGGDIIIIDGGSSQQEYPTIDVEAELECYHSEHFTNFQYTADDVLFVCSMAATVFNVIVILCAAKLFKRSGDTMHLFIISMTLGDLLLTGKTNCSYPAGRIHNIRGTGSSHREGPCREVNCVSN
jgi:hypothetical protein